MSTFQAIANQLSSLTSASIVIKSHKFITEDYSLVTGCCYENQDKIIYMILSEVEEIAQAIEAPMETVFKYILLHEIGHSLDTKLPVAKAQMRELFHKEDYFQMDLLTFRIEVEAWRIADTLVPIKTKVYKLLRAWALSSYGEEYGELFCPDYFPAK